jgi:HK97 family phage prohead protease
MTDVTTFALEIREAKALDDGRHVIEALCVPWNTPTMLTPHRGGEVFARGAFGELIANPQAWPKVRLTDSHLDSALRRPVAKGLEFRDDPRGLAGTFQFFNTPTGREAWENVVENTYGGVSVGFIATDEGKRDGMREVRTARLHHVSLVDEPAYADAQVVAMRAAQHADDDLREFFRHPYVAPILPPLPPARRLG